MGTAGLPIALSILSEGGWVYQCFGPSISGQKKLAAGHIEFFLILSGFRKTRVLFSESVFFGRPKPGLKVNIK